MKAKQPFPGVLPKLGQIVKFPFRNGPTWIEEEGMIIELEFGTDKLSARVVIETPHGRRGIIWTKKNKFKEILIGAK